MILLSIPSIENRQAHTSGLPVRASATVVIEQKDWYSLSYTSLFMSAFPIFPASRPASIFGDHELNFCVRYGNRWTLAPINTD